MNELKNWISVNSDIRSGQPIISGTRIKVETILNLISAGHTFDEIIEFHPQLNRESIRAAITYAIETIRMEKVFA
jgi:uncharacterized protein (DUF433 family)